MTTKVAQQSWRAFWSNYKRRILQTQGVAAVVPVVLEGESVPHQVHQAHRKCHPVGLGFRCGGRATWRRPIGSRFCSSLLAKLAALQSASGSLCQRVSAQSAPVLTRAPLLVVAVVVASWLN
jgi:hypothetical protein